jgi:hypothetical protein
MADFLVPPVNQVEQARFYQELCRQMNKKRPVIPDDSTASDIAGIVADFNTLLANLRTAFE